MKAIIIGSGNLPVVSEYLPITHEDGFLTHYDETWYTNALKYAGLDKNDIRDVFKKNTQKVMDVYYPLSSSAGDIRSTIIYTCENPTHGQTIELEDASPIYKFNIWVKWLDTYGNLHDLFLYPRCLVFKYILFV